jgi:germination protein M
VSFTAGLVLLVGCGGGNGTNTKPTTTTAAMTSTTSPGIANPASVYCESRGGKVEIVTNQNGQQGICRLADGTSVDEWDFYRANHPTTSTTPQPSTSIAPAATTIRVYFVEGEKITAAAAPAPGDPAIATAAMNALLAGPHGLAAQIGMTTQIPAGTRLLGVSIATGTATVDLSGSFQSGGGSLSMQLRVAQVVYTLTQFATVQRVEFKLDGTPVQAIGGEGLMVTDVTRSTFESVTPTILVEAPLPGETVTSPIRAAGTADTFEATVNYTLTDPNGSVLQEGFTTATSGSGARGTFSAAIAYPAGSAGAAMLSVYEVSAKDGSHINVITVPLHLT